MEGLPIIEYEPYRISWNEEENTFYFDCSDVSEFRPDNYLLFHNIKTGNKTTFELIEAGNEGWLYHSIGDEHGMKKYTKLLAIK